MTTTQTVKARLLTYIRYLGIGQAKFEDLCGLSHGYVNNIRRSISPDKLQLIALQNPDLNTGWLMTGDGEMLKDSSAQIVGDISNSTVSGVNVKGKEIHINNADAFKALLNIVESYQESTARFQSQHDKMLNQMDRLIAVIENKNEVKP